MRTLQKSLVIGLYVFAAIIGFLLVAYHLFFIWYSSLGEGKAISVLGIVLAIGNLIYPLCVLLLLTVRALRPHIYKPQVILAVIIMIPILFYVNYLLVEKLTPYDYQS
jgi:uncharacterized PurR-regulated membrane protein YhhQ (DUF165 family)